MSEPRRKIKLLPDTLKNQIAAGEVVERPSSVVKELVENSLDAGADLIDVLIERGGQGYISVQDNGSGIPADELEAAVTRHATSKIETVRELFSVRSFGFRGEALASTASVSRMRLASRAEGADEAAYILVEKGEITDQGPDGPARGTRVDIRDLFLGVPARLKFLKTEATEARKCREVVFRQALAHLGAGFSFESNGKKAFQLLPGETLQVRLSHFWPPAVCSELRDFAYESDGRRVYGLAGAPSTAQSRADRMLFYVNGRPVQDRMLMSAVREAYKGRLLSKESPQVVVFVDLPLNEVDVNVHPAKTEVRFTDERAVFSLVRRGILQALAADELSPQVQGAYDRPMDSRQTPRPVLKTEARGESRSGSASEQGNLFSSSPKYPSYAEYKAEIASGPNFEGAPVPVPGSRDVYDSVPEGSSEPEKNTGYQDAGYRDMGDDSGQHYAAESSAAGQVHPTQPISPIPPVPPAQSGRLSEAEVSGFPHEAPSFAPLSAAPGITYLGQVAGTYLILKFGEETLGLLDQHAAHERVLFEKMRRDKARGDARPLAVPLSFALHGSEAEELDRIREGLSAMGFRLSEPEDGGCEDGGCEVTAVPPSLEPGRALEFLRAAVSGQSRGLEDLWIMLSCRSAIKGGDALAPDEALALIREWLAVPEKEFCPHGRPALLRFSGGDLEKMFKRRG